MKKLYTYLYITLYLSIFSTAISSTLKQDTLPFTYERFCEQEGLEIHQGFYTIYKLDKRYFIEIPAESFNRETLITIQVVKGYSSYVSDASGVVQFERAKGNLLQLIRCRNMETRSDTVDLALSEAIEKSSLLPIDYTFPILSRGKDGKSCIIELTNELNSASGLFNVSSMNLLNHPDPQRSGVNSTRNIRQGVVFSLIRSQTDFVEQSQNRKKADAVSTFELEVLIQMLPTNRDLTMKPNNPAYGFATTSIMEYDVKKYLAHKKEYINRWKLSASKKELNKQQKGAIIEPESPITIYIDPITPLPFVESIKNAVSQWSETLKAAGWKNVFRFSSDKEDSSLSYRTILFRWGNAFNGPYSSIITHPQTGEILTARINIMDAGANDLLTTYFLQCNQIDPRIRKDLYHIDVRKEILTVQAAAIFAEVLGMRPNKAGATAFPLENLHSYPWLKKYGPTASVTSGTTFNYVLSAREKYDATCLLPKVSIYDLDAIKYAYGNSQSLPTFKKSFYAEGDPLDPSTLPGALSEDILKASIQGIDQLKITYMTLEQKFKDLPAEQNTWKNLSSFSIQALALYQRYLTQIIKLIGGRSIQPIIREVSEQRIVYVSKEEQEKALSYLEKNVFSEIPQWVYSDIVKRSDNLDIDHMMVGLAEALIKEFTNKEQIQSLVLGEELLGTKAFTPKDLFSYIDRVIFENFDKQKTVSSYRKRVQLCFVNALSSAVALNNISFGISGEGNNLLHTYFITIAQKIKWLSENHEDQQTRDNYLLMMMKMNREYFEK